VRVAPEGGRMRRALLFVVRSCGVEISRLGL